MTPWLFYQNHLFDMAKLCHQMLIRQNGVHCQVAHSICYHLSFIYGGWPSRLNPLKLSQRQWSPCILFKVTCSTWQNYVTRCHQMLIRQNGVHCQVAHSICYHLSFIYGGWPSRLNPLKLSQRQWSPCILFKVTCSTWQNYVTRCHQMLIRQNGVHCQVAHSICYHLSFIYGGWPSRLNPLKLFQRQWPLDFFIKITCSTWQNYVTRCRYDKTEYTAR